jgi:putative Mn2+ efflux pump MntP
MISTLLIGLSLSMDAFAISVGSGICIPNLKRFYALRSSIFFGVFQFVMPAAGWYLGYSFASYIKTYDHWIAFGLLAFIGGKMIFESLRRTGDRECPEETPAGGKGGDIRSLPYLLTLSVATSIDALAVGLSFSMLGRGIWAPAAVIGGVTFVVCLLGFEFGRRIGRVLEKWAGLAGGLVLAGIGVKILLEHLLGP